ncbi:UvrD-helicase domain-containing protein [bacterium]|nr:UvrD-helicase domain-containing protein [bacterium]
MKKFIIYSSSAGSGKTFTLAKKYIEYVLAIDKKDKFSPEQTIPKILAITFTNNSTKEMKERILNYLEEIYADPENSTIFKIIEKEAKISKDELRNRAKLSLDHIYSNYNDFHISTIDSFLQKILRTFSREVDIPVNYDITLDEGEIIDYATDRIFEEYGKDKLISSSMTRMLREKLDDNRSWDITNDIKKDAEGYYNKIQRDNAKYELLGRDDLFLNRSNFFENYKNIYGLFNGSESNLKEKIKIFLEEFSSHLDLTNKIKRSDLIVKFCNKILNNQEPNFSDTILNHYEEFDLKKGEVFDNTELFNKLNEEFREIVDIYREFLKLKSIKKKIHTLFIYFFIENEISRFKRSRGILFLSDAVKIIKNLNEDADSWVVADFLYYKLGEKYQHILIDEFQDTSFEQWMALYPLTRETLENNGDVILVGDIKQAIYRWRGGEKVIMQSLLNSDETSKVVLDKNFRSVKEIVEFNNEFFNELKNSKIYWDPEDIEQEPFRKDDHGYIEIKELPKEKDEFITNYIEDIARRRGTPENPAYGDITILIRRNCDTDGLIPLLLEKDIPVVSKDALKIGFDTFIQFLVAFLRYFNEPNNYKNKFYVLLYNYLDIPIESIIENVKTIKSMNPAEFFDYIAGNNDILKSGLSELYNLREGISLFGMVVSLTNLFKNIIKEHIPYISALLNVIKAALDSGGISEFLSKWDDLKETSIGSAVRTNSVNISTMHSAKGLEFPVVLFPYEPKKMNLEKEDIVRVKFKNIIAYVSTTKANMSRFPEAEEERKDGNYDYANLLYVTFTRAKDELYIFPSLKVDKTGFEPDAFAKNMRALTENSQLLKTNDKDTDFIKKYYGKKPKNVSHKAENIFVRPLDFKNYKWHDRLVIARSKKKYDEKESQEINFGNAFHRYMELTKGFEYNKVLYENICSIYDLNDKEKKELEDSIKRIIGTNTIKEISQYSIKKEVAVIFNQNLIDRIDLLAIKDNNAVIVDYKTGKEDEEYIKKMNEYISIVRNAGYDNVRGIILFTNGKQIKVEN